MYPDLQTNERQTAVEDNIAKDALDLFVQLRRLRLDIVGWVNKRLTQHGINLPQYTLLEKLDEVDEATMGALSDKLGVTMGAATNLVDRLVHAEHVVRNRSEADRRVVQVKLTDSGRELLYRITDDTAAFLAGFFREIGPEDRRITITALAKVAELLANRAPDER